MIKHNKILVVQTSFIGDVILATSLLETLHSEHPKARIDVLVRKGCESIFEGHPFLETVHVWNKKEGKYKTLLNTIKAVRAMRYDLIVNPHRFASSGLICMLSKAKNTVGFKKNPLSFFYSKSYDHLFDGTHEIERNHLLISDAVNLQKPLTPKLYPQASDFEKVKPFKECSFRCFAPTSVWFTKQWSIEKWIELIDSMPIKDQVYLLGAPADSNQCDEIKAKTNHPKVQNLAGKLSLLQSAALMKDAEMNYVNDSAPMHLCSSMNAPTTAVFCSTVPRFGFGPLSDDSKIIETTEKLDCRPCGLHGYQACPKGHFKCSTSIDISQFHS